MKLLIAITMMVFTSTSVFAACTLQDYAGCSQDGCNKLANRAWKVVPPSIEARCIIADPTKESPCLGVNDKLSPKEEERVNDSQPGKSGSTKSK